LLKKIGDRVDAHEGIVRIHYKDAGLLEHAEERLKKAILLSEKKPQRLPLVIDHIYAKESADKRT
jgi:thymidine phosphorylase